MRVRIILLTDLHIKPDSTPEVLPWVNHLCRFLCKNYYPETHIFVLGDIIDKGETNKSAAFFAANRVFSYIKTELSSIKYQMSFIPGNHDYCDRTLSEFVHFCKIHQSWYSQEFDFSVRKTWSYSYKEANFILTDSIQNGNYDMPGQLDTQGVLTCLLPEKLNILLLHHSLLFDDEMNHTGIIRQPQAIEFLKAHSVNYVFHGHTHTTRLIFLLDNIKCFGLGSIGLEQEKLGNLVNEQDQFLEIIINGRHVEVVKNWIYRSGMESYIPFQIYPTDSIYGERASATQKAYNPIQNYITRYILPRELASGDIFIRYFNNDKKTLLFETCCEHPHVLLIADAGLGKSTEMRNLAYVSSIENPYKLPILVPLNTYCGETIQDYIYMIAPEYKTLNPEQFLLIMDGYDEISDVGSFKRNLKQYIVQNPNTHICISMRSNFLVTVSELFLDFVIYQLLELEHQSILDELNKQCVDSDDFLAECNQKGLNNLLNNPFYLNEIIKLYLRSKELPLSSEIMGRIIEAIISEDKSKYEYSTSSLEESRYEIMLALTRLAYGMQLLNIFVLDDDKYQTLLCREDRDLLKINGLIINTPNGHMFSHNNFREYLVAKHLSMCDSNSIIEQVSVSNAASLNHNWLNVIGFFLQMKQDNELTLWLNDIEPLALTKLEPAHINAELRFQIFRRTLEDIIRKNIWFRNDMCSTEGLAMFSQSKQVLELILQHIAAPAHFRSLNFCLNVLLSFSELYRLDERVRRVLVECYQSDAIRTYEKRYAIYSIAELGLDTNEITTDLVTRYKENSSSYERLGVYDYLLKTKSVNEYVSFLLSGLKYISYSYEDEEISNGSEHFRLKECIECIDTPEAVTELISWYSQEENINHDFYMKRELFSGFFLKAATHFNNGYYRLFSVVYNYFVNATRAYAMENISDSIKFFSDTSTIDCAFRKLVTEERDEKIFLIESIIMEKPEIIDQFCKLYFEDELDNPALFENFAARWQRTPEIFIKCSEIIKLKTGKVLEPPKPLVDYDRLQKEDTQCYFNALFSQYDARELLNKLLEVYGIPEITYIQLREGDFWRNTYPTGTKMLNTAIYRSGLKEQKIADFFELIDWNRFFESEIINILSNENRKKQITISQEQLAVLSGVYHNLECDMDLHTAFQENGTNKYTFSRNVQYYMVLKETLEFSSPESYYLGLLEIPHFFINGKNTVEEKYEYIEQYLSISTISERIIEIISKETRNTNLCDLFFGCKRYRLNEGKTFAIHYCIDINITVYNRRVAVEYLYELFGIEIVIREIIPSADETLFESIISIIKESDDRLKKELLSRYRKNKSIVLLKKMISLNMPEGLQAFIDESRIMGKPVGTSGGIGEATESISLISDIDMLPLLVEAVCLLFSEGFIDASFHSLYSSLLSAFTNCAKTDFNTVFSAINGLKEEKSENLECTGFCSKLQDDLFKNYNEKHIRTWTVQEARKVIMEIV